MSAGHGGARRLTPLERKRKQGKEIEQRKKEVRRKELANENMDNAWVVKGDVADDKKPVET